MRRAIIFLGSVTALIVLVSYVSTLVPAVDPFGKASSSFSADGVSQSMIAEMKLRHVSASPEPYDIGLFGNSRVLNVSSDNVTHGDCRLFNFAVGGESLRASAAMIEGLATRNRVPRLVVVSADHFELQMYNNPFFVSAFTRVRHFIGDVLAAIDAGAGLRQIVTITWRTVWTQALVFQRMFEYAFLEQAILQSLGLSSSSPTGAVYITDGSRRTSENIDGEPPLLSPTSGQVLPWQLGYDLQRIASAKTAGAEAVIIYESPLHPKSAAYFDQTPSPHAVQTRRAFKQACDTLGLVCITNGPKGTVDPNWSDAAHPPASVLGPYISDLIAPYQAVCRP